MSVTQLERSKMVYLVFIYNSPLAIQQMENVYKIAWTFGWAIISFFLIIIRMSEERQTPFICYIFRSSFFLNLCVVGTFKSNWYVNADLIISV